MSGVPEPNMNAKPEGVEEEPQRHVSTTHSIRTLTVSREPAEARLEHREAGLHAEDEERRDERPHRVDRIHDRVARERRRVLGMDRRADHARRERHQAEDADDAERLAGEQQIAVAPPFRIAQPRAQRPHLSMPRGAIASAAVLLCSSFDPSWAPPAKVRSTLRVAMTRPASSSRAHDDRAAHTSRVMKARAARCWFLVRRSECETRPLLS
jgi:hypothetical protein